MTDGAKPEGGKPPDAPAPGAGDSKATPDGAKKTEGSQKTSHEDLTTAYQKGEREGTKGVLKSLGFESLDAAKAAIAAGAQATVKLDSTKSDLEKKTDASIAEMRALVTQFISTSAPIVEESAKIIENDLRQKVFTKLRVKDADDMAAYMALHPAKEDEALETHVARLIEMKPKLAYKEGEKPVGSGSPGNPNPPAIDADSKAPGDETQKHMERLFKLQGGSQKLLDQLRALQSKN